MTDLFSPMGHGDDDGSSSPKRKKMRQKYAPKACLSCRRSKLKCTGENPCQRCVDNNRRCFYSEDQTAAEVLQNLSRPAPVQHQETSSTNGGPSTARRGTLPRLDGNERRTSDASALGSSLEGRMARMEIMMEALINDRGLTMTSRGSVERNDHESDGIGSEAAYIKPILDPIHPALAQLGQHTSGDESTAMIARHASMASNTSDHIRVGDRILPFPNNSTLQKYMNDFFRDVHLRHPCINESDFIIRVQRLTRAGIAQSSDVNFLALNYILFACCDALYEKSQIVLRDAVPPGWTWFQLADSIIDRRLFLSGCDDTTWVRFLLFQAIYLTYVDLPSMALNAVRLACTSASNPKLYPSFCDPLLNFDDNGLYWNLCLFWNLVIMDHYISASCGQPPFFRLQDNSIEYSAGLYLSFGRESAVEPPSEWMTSYVIKYMRCMIMCIKLADKMRSLSIEVRTESVTRHLGEVLAEITNELRGVCNLGPNRVDWSQSNIKAIVELRVITAALLCGCKSLSVTLDIRSEDEHFRKLALQLLEKVRSHMGRNSASSSFRHDLTSAITVATRVFAMLLLNPEEPDSWYEHDMGIKPSYEYDMDAFTACERILIELSQSFSYALRVRRDCDAVISIVQGLIEKYTALPAMKRQPESWRTMLISRFPDSSQSMLSLPYKNDIPSLQGNGELIEGFEGVKADMGGTGKGVFWSF